jgi:hypothetical protein
MLGRKRILAHFGEETALCCAAAGQALGRRGSLQAMRDVINSGECVSLRQLAINGDDLLLLGFSGKGLGKTLWVLLEHVLEKPKDNTRETLLALQRKPGRKAYYNTERHSQVSYFAIFSHVC